MLSLLWYKDWSPCLSLIVNCWLTWSWTLARCSDESGRDCAGRGWCWAVSERAPCPALRPGSNCSVWSSLLVLPLPSHLLHSSSWNPTLLLPIWIKNSSNSGNGCETGWLGEVLWLVYGWKGALNSWCHQVRQQEKSCKKSYAYSHSVNRIYYVAHSLQTNLAVSCKFWITHWKSCFFLSLSLCQSM